MKINWFRS